MRSADTNIIVRLLMQDHPDQQARILALLRQETLSVTVTVILETEWVLRSAYRLSPSLVQRALRNLLGLPELLVESAESVGQAVAWFEQGMDFADALHLATAHDSDGFVTYDRDFIKTAARIGAGNVAEP